jgi:hypothetical protein
LFPEDDMLVTFSTDTYPSITLFGDDALAMLDMMGHSRTVPGSIRAEDVPRALASLKTAVAATKGVAPPKQAGDEDEPAVSTAHRALPLIELLTAAVNANDYVMWDKSTIIK